jgi:ABC-type Na+ efflux pump permease subunit
VSKIRTIANYEFNSAVRTKSFVISIIMLPVIWGGAILIQVLLAKGDTRPLAFAVVDRTGSLYPTIDQAAQKRNEGLTQPDGKNKESPFYPKESKPAAGAAPDAVLQPLADEVRRGTLHAFVEIPEDAVIPEKAPVVTVRYYSETPTDDRLVEWLEPLLSREIERRRLAASGLDVDRIAKLKGMVSIENLSLAAPGAQTRSTAKEKGGTSPTDPSANGLKAEKVDMIRSFVVPAILMFIVFMIVLSSTPLLLNSVLEEKMSKISEVLLGSVTPFELLLGKLLGNVGVSLVLAALYLGCGYLMAARYGYGNVIPAELWWTLAVFLVLAVLLFGSMFTAVGAACSDLKDAQTLMLPVMLLVMLPAFLWTAIIRAPTSGLAVGASLFPPATPFLMLLRMALRPSPPPWQVLLSIVLTTATALIMVWAAGRILRVGLLAQGKAPSIPRLVKWVFTA